MCNSFSPWNALQFRFSLPRTQYHRLILDYVFMSSRSNQSTNSLFNRLHKPLSNDFSLNTLVQKREINSNNRFKVLFQSNHLIISQYLDAPIHLIKSLQVYSKSTYKGGSIININWHPQGYVGHTLCSSFTNYVVRLQLL